MYVCREMGGYSYRAIAERLREGSYSTVSFVCAALKARLGEDTSRIPGRVGFRADSGDIILISSQRVELPSEYSRREGAALLRQRATPAHDVRSHP